jgi:spore coat protein CotH
MSVKGAKSITVNSKTISVRMPYGSDVTSLRTAFSGDATITVNGETVTNNVANIDFSDPVTLAIGDNTYTVTISYSNLPIVYITTPDHVGITSKETYVEKSSFVIGNTENGKYDLTVAEGLNIKGRGNSTWSYPKKPYAVKFDKKQSILGMPKDKSWVLLANWMDRTVMRNAVAFEIAKRTKALAWTPNGDFVEVVLNGKFLGNYYLCEKIKISSDRVNITEIDNTKNVITEGDDLTGGYLVELDTYYDETYKFKTATKELPVNFKSPDEDVPDEQISYLQNYFNNIESILYSDDFPTNTGNYEDLIDVDSFIDWWFVHELTENAEPNHPKSSYMHKDKLGKLIAGPVWDFDWATYIPGRTTFKIAGAIWYDGLFKDPVFVSRIKEKWSESKSDFESVVNFIDTESVRIKESAEYNCELWPITQNINGDETLDYLSAVTRLRAAYVERIGVLDKLINNL